MRKEEDFTEETRVLFSRLYKKRITRKKAEEIQKNFQRLMELLKDLSQKESDHE